jgi:hypothetical protein
VLADGKDANEKEEFTGLALSRAATEDAEAEELEGCEEVSMEARGQADGI